MGDMTNEEREARDALQRAEILRKHQAERDRIEREREEHAATLAQETAKAQSELDTMMSVLDEHEQRGIRLQAYLHVLRSDWGSPNNLQAHVDQVALRLARYVVEGKV